ncbi:MAG TPA: M15 family metallopeptidase [Caulobacteraceae bacterium]|nr:M15 family metallopeptidase [Caulobacteraceae bacterium]
MTRTLLQILQWLVILVAVVALGVLVLRRCEAPASHAPPLASAPLPEPRTPLGVGSCAEGGYADAATDNAITLQTLAWAPFRRPEVGWAIYAPRIAQTISTDCGPETPAFSAALAAWQHAHRLPVSGRLDPGTFESMKQSWFAQGLHTRAPGSQACPDPPPETALDVASPAESYGGKTILLRPEALAAYRRMAAAARRALPSLAADPTLLTIFSGYRSPAADDARCVSEANCSGPTRAACSPHRTGLAVDITLGSAPGFRIDSSADRNRLYMSRTPAYRWLLAHAAEYGFVNYAFEPWHWEFVGSGGPRSSARPPSGPPPA